jgi:ABC-type enterochelin transport system permease subunit
MKNKLSFRELLTLILVFFSMSMLFYILINWGAEMEILTLLIGLIGGTVLGSITGTYYGSNHKTNIDNETRN